MRLKLAHFGLVPEEVVGVETGDNWGPGIIHEIMPNGVSDYVTKVTDGPMREELAKIQLSRSMILGVVLGYGMAKAGLKIGFIGSISLMMYKYIKNKELKA